MIQRKEKKEENTEVFDWGALLKRRIHILRMHFLRSAVASIFKCNDSESKLT